MLMKSKIVVRIGEKAAFFLTTDRFLGFPSKKKKRKVKKIQTARNKQDKSQALSTFKVHSSTYIVYSMFSQSFKFWQESCVP